MPELQVCIIYSRFNAQHTQPACDIINFTRLFGSAHLDLNCWRWVADSPKCENIRTSLYTAVSQKRSAVPDFVRSYNHKPTLHVKKRQRFKQVDRIAGPDPLRLYSSAFNPKKYRSPMETSVTRKIIPHVWASRNTAEKEVWGSIAIVILLLVTIEWQRLCMSQTVGCLPTGTT